MKAEQGVGIPLVRIMVYVYKVCLFVSISAMLRPFWPIIYIKMFSRIFANWTISDIFHFFSIMCGSNYWFTIPPPGGSRISP